MQIVNIYVKEKWTGAMKGSGKAAALIVYETEKGICHKKMVKTEVEDSTRNRLHLQIVTKALHALKRECSVGMYMADAEYIKNAIEQNWIHEWKKSGWKNKRGNEVKNQDIWKLLDPMLEKHQIGIVAYIGRYDKELEEALESEEE